MQKGTDWGVLGEGRGLLAFGWSAWASQEGGLGGKMRRTRVITQEHDWGRLLPGRETAEGEPVSSFGTARRPVWLQQSPWERSDSSHSVQAWGTLEGF